MALQNLIVVLVRQRWISSAKVWRPLVSIKPVHSLKRNILLRSHHNLWLWNSLSCLQTTHLKNVRPERAHVFWWNAIHSLEQGKVSGYKQLLSTYKFRWKPVNLMSFIWNNNMQRKREANGDTTWRQLLTSSYVWWWCVRELKLSNWHTIWRGNEPRIDGI